MAEKYEVFISFKNTAPEGGLTVDRVIAERLHAMLRAEGMNVFFSEKDLSETDFMEQIYMALDEAELLIVVGSAPEYVRSKWVKSEWMNFIGAINSGRKPDGKVMTVLSGMDTHGLPLELSNYQSFDAEKLENAVAYAFDVLGKVRNSEAQKRLDEENARLLKEAEEEKRQAIKGQTEAKHRTEQEKEKADKANKKAQSAERKAAEERKKRLAAEGKVKKSAKQRMIRWIITAAAVLLLAAVGVVAAVLGVFKPEWEYTQNKDGSVTAAKYNGLDSDVVIPEEIKGRKVTGISEYLFTISQWSDITSITIPDSVTTIGDHAFANCEKLTSVIMGDGVETIGDEAFELCDSLTSVTMGNSVKTIGEGAFRSCFALTSVTIPDGVKRIGKKAFYACSSLTSVNIPDSVNTIGDGAFYGCTGITSITIGKGVHIIEKHAFAYCDSLNEVVIPDNIETISSKAFYCCRKLTSVTIGKGVRNIGENALLTFDPMQLSPSEDDDEKRGDFTLTVSSDNSYFSAVDNVLLNKSRTELLLFPCGKAGEYTVPDSVSSIGENAFRYCLNLTSVIIPDSVVSIGDNAFYGCKQMTSITVGSGVNTIGQNALSCSVSKLDSNETNRWYLFADSSLTEINVSPSNDQFCSVDGVLMNKRQTTLLVFPCGRDGDYVIPDGVTSIENWAFQFCYALNSLTIPESVETINENAFQYCRGFTIKAPHPTNYYDCGSWKNWVVQ